MPALTLEFHVIQPPLLEPQVVAHVLILQSALDTKASHLVTVFDSFLGSRPEDFLRLAITTDSHLGLHHVRTACGYTDDPAQVPCRVLVDSHILRPDQFRPFSSGRNIVLNIHRQVVQLPSDHVENAGLTFLQTSASAWPSKKSAVVEISLSELLELDNVEAQQVPIRFLHLQYDTCLPDELCIPDDATESEVEHLFNQLQLSQQYHVYMTSVPGTMLTVPMNWASHGLYHYVYCPHLDTEFQDLICHSAPMPLVDLDHMKFLHRHGLVRAVILRTVSKRPGLTFVYFHNNVPCLDVPSSGNKARSPWPAKQPTVTKTCLLDVSSLPRDCSAYRLDIGLTRHHLEQFFHSGNDILCPWYSHLDLPSFVLQGIQCLGHPEGTKFDFQAFDRLIVYTDGSSKPCERRKPPLRVEDQGTADAWAFAVIGEIYATHTQPGSLTFLGWQAQQIRYESDSQAFIGTDQIGAEYAEREALFFAGLWRLSININTPTIFRSDSSTTCAQTSGLSGFTDFHCTHAALRGLFQTLIASLGSAALAVEHVRGHSGDVWNELVDYLAKTEAVKSHHIVRQTVDLRVFLPAIPYMWMLFDTTSGLPVFTEQGFDVHPPNQPAESALHCIDPAPSVSKPVQFQISLASFNVGSLSAKPDGYSGKLSYVRQQMTMHSLNFLGIQESRSPPAFSLVDNVIRIAGGAEKGQLGVELWISTAQPFAHCRGKPLYFSKSHVQLLYHDSRRLIVRIACPVFDCFIVVLHAPQSGKSFQERAQWWNHTVTIVQQLCSDFPTFVLLDANAKTGMFHPPIVFEKDDATSSGTPLLLEFLESKELCLPCTSNVHVGEQTTWTAIDGESHHRIDYVAIPQTWLPHCTLSQIIATFDNGNLHTDHAATAIQLEWTEARPCNQQRSKSYHHDRAGIAPNRHRLALTNFPDVGWKDDIETQVLGFNRAIHSALQSVCPATPALPKKSSITTATWDLRTEKLHLKKRLQILRKHKADELLARFFHLWSRPDHLDQYDAVCAHFVTILCAEVSLSCRYWKKTHSLKTALQRDRTTRLQTVIEQTGTDAAASTLLHVLKPFLGPTNPMKQKKACLPIVKDEFGEICRTPEAAQNRWIRFFMDMEGGRRMDYHQYRQHWLEGLQQFGNVDAFVLSIQDLPTLTELENAFRRVQPGKAIGLDRVPPELCSACPVLMARHCYSMMMKVALFGQEAMEHKGGKLAIAWKQRGDVRDCHTHRSLLVSSHVGKTIHRALRQKYNSLYNAFMQRQQLGGRPRIPVAVPLHMTRAFLRWQMRNKQPTALIFLDLTEAFYRTLRPLAVGGSCSDHCISLMCHRLGLGSDALHDLHTFLQQPSALEDACAPPHVLRMFQALHRDTWFQLGSQEDFVRTEIGSRPGDSFADTVFGFLWAKLLRKLELALLAHGLLEMVPDIALPRPFHTHVSSHETDTKIPLLGPTWMDDLNILLTASSNAAIVSKAQHTLSLLLDLCADFQMLQRREKLK